MVYSKGVNLKNIYGVHRACRYLVKLYSELQLLVEGLICLLSALFYVPTHSSKSFMKLQHFKCKVVLKIDDYCAFLLFLPTYVITMWLRSPIEAQFVFFLTFFGNLVMTHFKKISNTILDKIFGKKIYIIPYLSQHTLQMTMSVTEPTIRLMSFILKL